MRDIWRLVPRPVRTLLGLMLIVQALLSVLYVLRVAGAPGTRQFDMDGELNIPTWWSCTILVTAGLAAILLSRVNRPLGRPTAPWMLVGLGLLALSCEEVASIHEDVGTAVGGGPGNVSVWPLVYAPVAIAGGWLLLRALRDLPRPLALVGIAGLVSYVAVLGAEVLALAAESRLTILVEENLEMLGTALMFTAVASELVTRASALFERRPSPAPEAGRHGRVVL